MMSAWEAVGWFMTHSFAELRQHSSTYRFCRFGSRWLFFQILVPHGLSMPRFGRVTTNLHWETICECWDVLSWRFDWMDGTNLHKGLSPSTHLFPTCGWPLSSSSCSCGAKRGQGPNMRRQRKRCPPTTRNYIDRAQDIINRPGVVSGCGWWWFVVILSFVFVGFGLFFPCLCQNQHKR